MTPAEIRAQLISDLETGSAGEATPIDVKVYDVWPDRVAPPCAVIGLEPVQYILGGQTFGTYELRLTVLLLVQRSQSALSELEDLIMRTLNNTADFGINGVDTPAIFTLTGMELLGSTVHLRKQAKL